MSTGALTFFGRAESRRVADEFVARVRESADKRNLAFIDDDVEDEELAICVSAGAEDLVISFDEDLVLDGSVKPSRATEDSDVQIIASLFGSAYQLLEVFMLVDEYDDVILEHGDTEELD